MSVRSNGYDNDSLDRILRYFMQTIHSMECAGVAELPLESDLDEPYKSFLDIVMRIFLSAEPPELSRLMLDAEHDAFISGRQLTVEMAMGLRMVKELAWHIWYDVDRYGYLLSTQNLWGNLASEYAHTFFYPGLPEEIGKKYHVEEWRAQLFHRFASQEERKHFGGGDFIELQYCRVEQGTEIEKLVSVDAIQHWRNDSLYICGDDMDTFYSHYGEIITDGIYNNKKSGPVDMFGINYFSPEKTRSIMEQVQKARPLDYMILLRWLKEVKQYNGFYVLGE